MKNKKPLWIAIIAVDVAVTAFFFVIHIIMLASLSKSDAEREAMTGLIRALMDNSNLYLWAFVVPLFVILAANIIGLVIYVRKTTKKEVTKLDDLSEDQKEALRQQLLAKLAGETKPAAEEPKPVEEPQPVEEPKPEEQEKPETPKA